MLATGIAYSDLARLTPGPGIWSRVRDSNPLPPDYESGLIQHELITALLFVHSRVPKTNPKSWEYLPPGDRTNKVVAHVITNSINVVAHVSSVSLL